MKKVLLLILLSAMLTLTACGKNENVSESVPQSASGYIPPVASSPPDSSSEDSESGSSETSDTSSESESEIAYKIGDLIGLEDLPSRGIAAYTVTINYVYLQDESRNRTVTEFYDEHGNMLFDGIYRYHSYEYNTDGMIVKEYEDYGYGTADIYEYEYDENRREIVTRKYDEDGRLGFVLEHSYDDHGEYAKCVDTYYLKDGSVVGPGVMMDKRFEYDENGRKIAAAEYHNEKIYSTLVFEYDGDVLKREVETMQRDDGDIVREYEYDADRNIVKYKRVHYNDDGTVKSAKRDERSYNADGKIEQKLYYDENDELWLKEIYEYTYADQN